MRCGHRNRPLCFPSLLQQGTRALRRKEHPLICNRLLQCGSLCRPHEFDAPIPNFRCTPYFSLFFAPFGSQRHRIPWRGVLLACVAVVFAACFGFPVHNLHSLHAQRSEATFSGTPPSAGRLSLPLPILCFWHAKIAGELMCSTANRLCQLQLDTLRVARLSRKAQGFEFLSEFARINVRVLAAPLPDFLRDFRKVTD